jgi:hypothetical protein
MLVYIPTEDSYWHEDTQTCTNNAYVMYVAPEYVDSVTKATGGILSFPDTIHCGAPDSLGAAYIDKEIEGGIYN